VRQASDLIKLKPNKSGILRQVLFIIPVVFPLTVKGSGLQTNKELRRVKRLISVLFSNLKNILSPV